MKDILENLLMHAKTQKDYDHIRSLAGVDLVINPDHGFARMAEAIGYLYSDNGLSAYATLSKIPDTLKQIDEEIRFYQSKPQIKSKLIFLRQFFTDAKHQVQKNPDMLYKLKA